MGGLKNISKVTLVIVLFITVILTYFGSKVTFDYDFESFFPSDDEETEFFDKHRRRFETDNDFIFIAFKNKPSVFDKAFLLQVKSFVDSLKKDSLVEDVQSLTHLKDYIKAPFSSAVFKKPYIDINNPSHYQKDSILIYQRPELVGYFINENADALMVTVKHRQYLSKKLGDRLKTNIDQLIAHLDFKDYVYAGRAIGINYYVDQMEVETLRFIGYSVILTILFLFITFRSLWGIWVPLMIVVTSMIWIVGYMGIVGQPINLILTVLPSIIFVVAMSDVIHLVSKYFDGLRLGLSRDIAIRTAYKEVGFATLLTSVTTAIGFLALLTVNMIPVRSFGIYTSIGVMFAFILAYTLLPSVLVLVKPPKIVSKSVNQNFWYRFLHRSFLFLIKKRKSVMIGLLGTLIIGGIGLSMVNTNYFLLEDLKEESSLRKDYEYFDKEFLGLRPFELAVEVKKPNLKITDYEVLKELQKNLI